MDEARRERIADARHLRVAREKEGGRRAPLARVERVARHATRLVEGDHGVVLMEDGEGELRLGRDARGQVGERDPVAGRDPDALGGRPPVHAHRALGDQPADEAARQGGERAVEEGIEPGRARSDGERQRGHGAPPAAAGAGARSAARFSRTSA